MNKQDRRIELLREALQRIKKPSKKILNAKGEEELKDQTAHDCRELAKHALMRDDEMKKE